MRKLLITCLVAFFVSGCLQNSSDSKSPSTPAVGSSNAGSENLTENNIGGNVTAPPPSYDFPVDLQIEISANNALRSLTALWKGVPSGFTFTLCAQSDTLPNNCKPIKTGMGHDGITSMKLGVDISFEQLLKNELSIKFFTLNGILVDSIGLVVERDEINGLIQYIKASNSERNDQFGTDIAMSGDGKILAVSAPFEDSALSNPNSTATVFNSGAVYIFTDTVNGWKQSAFIKFSHPGTEDYFGTRIDLSDDGLTLAVAMPNDDSLEVGGVVDPEDSSLPNSGAVIIFTNDTNNMGWRQNAILKSSNSRNSGKFSSGGLAISPNGAMLAVGTKQSALVETFTKDTNGNWSPFQIITATAVEITDKFGEEMAFSEDGAVLAIAASGNDSNSPFEGFSNNLLTNSGGVYIFKKMSNETGYVQSSFFKPKELPVNTFFGNSISLSSNGNTIAVGSDVYSTSTNNVYVFDFDPVLNMWQQRYLIDSPGILKGFGVNVELSKDASTLAVYSEAASNEPGINTEVDGNRADIYGHISVFHLSLTQALLKYSIESFEPTPHDLFGKRSAFSRDAKVFATTASQEDYQKSVVSNKSDISVPINSGAAFIYHF